MSTLHERVFELAMMESDGQALEVRQRAELEVHLAGCDECRELLRIHDVLERQADHPAASAWEKRMVANTDILLEGVRRGMQRRTRLEPVIFSLRVAAWAGLALLLLVMVQWIFANLGPVPAVLPVFSPTPDRATPAPIETPASAGQDAGVSVDPLFAGTPIGSGSWSPANDYFFIPVLEPSDDPESDRLIMHLHFVAAHDGRHCPVNQTFTGSLRAQNYAWLDNERLLFIDAAGRALLFKPCEEEVQDLSNPFNEPLLRVAQPMINPQLAGGGSLLLESAAAYWLLDPVTLQARPLADPLPTPDQADGFAWLPDGKMVSILQPLAEQPGRGRLAVLDLQSGEVVRSLEIESIGENTPLIEWMGADKAFVWGFGGGGPTLVDLAVNPPVVKHVLQDLFNLDLVYPDQINSMGVFYDVDNDGYHTVVHANLPDDTSIYVYHSETAQVDKLDGSMAVMMILPGDQRMPLAAWQDTPTYDDVFNLVYIDQPARSQVQMRVVGHTPRNYPNLESRLLPGGRMLFSSTQGVSMVALPGGETLAFWRLAGAEQAVLPSLFPAPDGGALIVMADQPAVDNGAGRGSLIYWITPDQPGAGGSP